MKKELIYQEEVYTYLDKLPACVIAINKLCKPENREKFIKVVENYINEKGRGANGFDMDFNKDFTKLHKFDLVL